MAFHVGSTLVRIEPKFSLLLMCAENIKKYPHRQPESTWNHVRYKVGELPHDYSGRNFEPFAIHKLLDEFHSNWSVNANIVCIRGPAGCGKSTLARKYAFDHFDKYYSDVVWIEAHSVDSMRSSFEGLAAELKLPAESDTRRLVTSVYIFFNLRNCLFVFDGLKSMEDFFQFRPQITSPLFQTPYLLITSRSSGLAPDPRNELCITHDSAIVLQISKRIERENKSGADLLKALAYLDPEKISVRFLQAVFEQIETNGGGDFEPTLALLRKLKVIKLSVSSSVNINPSMQEAIRSSLTAKKESSVLDKLRNTHQALIEKEGTEGGLTRECTAHRLHVLSLDLKSISLRDHFDRLRYDFENRREYSLTLSMAQHAHAILESRFGGNKNEMTIFSEYTIASSHYHLENYTQAIRLLNSLFPVAQSVLGKRHWATGDILRLLRNTYSAVGDSERVRRYDNEYRDWLTRQES